MQNIVKFCLVDFEAFIVNRDTIIRELSIVRYIYNRKENMVSLNELTPMSLTSKYIDTQFFKPTPDWEFLSVRDKRQNLNAMKRYHGLSYSPVETLPSSEQAKSFLLFACHDCDIVLCNGLDKYFFLARFIPKFIINIQSLGCTKLIFTVGTEKYFQKNFCEENRHKISKKVFSKYLSGRQFIDKIHILSHCSARKVAFYLDWIYENNKSKEILQYFDRVSYPQF